MIDVCLDKMDDLLGESWNLPFSGGKSMVDIEKMRKLIDEVRFNLPQELKEAKAIVANRKDILTEAQEEAEDIIRRAEQKARALVDAEEVTREANERANSLMSETKRKTKEMERVALERVQQLLQGCEDSLLAALTEVKTKKNAVTKHK